MIKLIFGGIGLFVAALITELPVNYAFWLSVAVGLLSFALVLMGIERFTRESRVIRSVDYERHELEIKIQKLNRFICSSKFNSISEYHRGLLRSQLGAMLDYERVLYKRLNDLRGV